MGTTTKEIGSSSFNDMISSVDRRSEYVENRAGANVRLNNFLTPYTLDDKSSILNAPCGYSNGVYASLRPSDARGPELITNGTFDSDSDWTKGTGWVIENGKASRTAQSGSTSCYQSISLTGGKKYKIQYDLNITAGSFKIRIGGGTLVDTITRTTSGTYTEYIVANSGNNVLNLRANDGAFVGSIDNVSVKEDTSADLDFVRGTAATRVTKDGLVKNVQILSGELVQNGNFDEIGSEEVSNGDFSQQGSEEVVNGGFDTDSGWIKGAGWSISGGKAIVTNSTVSSIYQDTLDLSKLYKVTFEITEISSGSLRIGIGVNFSDYFTQVGTYTYYGKPSTDTLFRINPSSGTNASIDNVSVVEVGQDWVFSSECELVDSQARIYSSDGSFQYIRQNNVLNTSKQYKLEFDVISSNGADLVVVGVPNAISTSVLGRKTVYFNPTSTYFQINRSSGVTDVVVDNISVKEVGQNWTFDSGWSMGDNVAVRTDTGTYTSLYQDILTSGRKYKVTITMDSVVSSELYGVRLGTNYVLRNVLSAAGTYTAEGVANSATLSIVGDLNFEGSVSSISVIEITDDTNLPRIDYTNGTGALLLEPQSTNSIPYSEDFSQGVWAKRDSTLTSGFTSPSGDSSAYKLTVSAVDGQVVYSYSSGNTNTKTVSVFAKADTTTSKLRIIEQYYLGHRTDFDLNLGVIEFNNSAGAKMEYYGNGWYRCTHIQSYSSGQTSATFALRSATADSFYLWGAQLEELPYASSYIPTNGSTVTRNKDQAYRSGISNLINSAEGVLYAEIAWLDNQMSPNNRISISDGTTANRILLQNVNSTANRIQFYVIVNSVAQADFFIDLSNITLFNKIAIKYKANDFSVFINGVNVLTDTSGTTFSNGTLTKLSFDGGDGNNDFFGRVRSLAVFNEALTDEELAKITSTTQQEVFYEMRDKMQQINADYYEFGDYTTRLKKLF